MSQMVYYLFDILNEFIYLLIYLHICLGIYLLLFVTNMVVNFFRSLKLFRFGNYDSADSLSSTFLM